MKAIKLTIDTNLINIKRSLPSMNTLERWQEEGKVELIGTARLKMETANHPKSTQKADAMKNVSEPGFWGVSNWGRSLWGSEDTIPNINELTKVLFPNFKNVNTTPQNARNDVMHLMAHANARNDFFLTSDKKDFIVKGRREKLKEIFNIVVMTPEEAVEFLSNEFGWH